MTLPLPLFPEGESTPVQVLIGRGRPSLNISKYIDLDGGGLRIEDTGNQQDDAATLEAKDIRRLIDDIGPEASILIKTGAEERFRGFIRQYTPRPFVRSNSIIINAVGVSSLLDTCIIPPGVAYDRGVAESDRARILWLLNTFGGPFLKHASNDFSKIQLLEERMERQKFGSLTLRQAIEQVLGAASESANYYVDQPGRIHTWDNDHLEEEESPYEVVTSSTLAANQVAPTDLEITWDTADLINYYIVRGSNRAGSGHFSDAESIELYGRRQAFLDGPNSDTVRKARRLGRAGLNDTKNPTKRVSFTVDHEYATRNGSVWQPGQYLYVTADGFGWLRHRLRVVRTTTTYLDATGSRQMDIEAGAFRRSFINGLGSGGAGPSGGSAYFPRGYIPGGTGAVYDPPWEVTDDGDRAPCFACPEADLSYYVLDDFARDDMSKGSFGTTPTSDVTGAPWDGGNIWVATAAAGVDSWGIYGQSLYLQDTYDPVNSAGLGVYIKDTEFDSADESIVSTERPDLPFAEATSVLVRWMVDRIADGSGVGQFLTIRWSTSLYNDSFDRINCAATVWFRRGSTGLTGIQVDNDPQGYGDQTIQQSPFTQKIVAANTWYLLRVDFRQSKVRAKFWAESGDEPSDWDVEAPHLPGATNPTQTDNEFRMSLRAGDAVSQRITVDYIKVATSGIEGTAGTDTMTGNGSTTTFSLAQQSSKVTRVTVDGTAVDNYTVNTVAGYIQSITLDAAPASGAGIVVEYVLGPP